MQLNLQGSAQEEIGHDSLTVCPVIIKLIEQIGSEYVPEEVCKAFQIWLIKGTTNSINVLLKIQWIEFHHFWYACSEDRYWPKSKVLYWLVQAGMAFEILANNSWCHWAILIKLCMHSLKLWGLCDGKCGFVSLLNRLQLLMWLGSILWSPDPFSSPSQPEFWLIALAKRGRGLNLRLPLADIFCRCLVQFIVCCYYY